MKKIISIALARAAAVSAFSLCLFIDNGARADQTASDLQLLARAVNGEARGEPYEGQVAVSDGQINVPIDPSSTVYKACQDALNGWDPSEGAIYYFNPETATSSWIWSRTLIKVIGNHRFCK